MRLLSILPVMPLYYNGKTKFTPIHVSDFSNIIFEIVQKNYWRNYRMYWTRSIYI